MPGEHHLHEEKEVARRLYKSAPERKTEYPDLGKGAMIPDGYEGRNIDDRISETEGNLPGGDFVDALLSDTGRRVQAATGMAEKPSTTRFSETEEGCALSAHAQGQIHSFFENKKHRDADDANASPAATSNDALGAFYRIV